MIIRMFAVKGGHFHPTNCLERFSAMRDISDPTIKLQIYDKYKDDYTDNSRYIFKELVQQNNNLKQEKQKVLDSTSFKIGHQIVSSLSFVLKILKFKST